MSLNDARAIPRYAEPTYFDRRIRSGIASGEAIINEVRDQTDIDPGVADKRLLVIEPVGAADG